MNDEFSAVDVSKANETTSEPVVNTNVGGGSGGYRIRRLRCCTRDGGWLALRSLPAGGGFKAPCAAAVTAVRGERHGKGALSACQLGTGKMDYLSKDPTGPMVLVSISINPIVDAGELLCSL